MRDFYRNRLKIGALQQISGTGQIIALYGYFAGGFTGARTANTDRITFSTGTTAANTVSNLSVARSQMRGISNKVTYGYVIGGIDGAGTAVATADRITFSTGVTASNTVSDAPTTKNFYGSLSDGVSYGYLVGGQKSGIDTTETLVITFSSEVTAANTASAISAATINLFGISDAINYGYISGGITAGNIIRKVTYRITFSTKVSSANTASDLNTARFSSGSISDNSLYGYIAGGETNTSSASYIATTEKITFSTGVFAASTVSNLSQAKESMGSSSDGICYGYLSGGYTGAAITTADRITFSTSVTSANTISDLSVANRLLASLSDYAV